MEKIETSTPAVNPAYYTEGETITYEITVTKGANGFTMQVRRKGLAFFLR